MTTETSNARGELRMADIREDAREPLQLLREKLAHDEDGWAALCQLMPMLAAAPPPAAEGVQAGEVSAEDVAVLHRIKAALPDVGVNGWYEGVQALERVLARLSQQPEARGVVDGYDPNELLRAAMALIRRGHSIANDPGDEVLVQRIADHLAAAQQQGQGACPECGSTDKIEDANGALVCGNHFCDSEPLVQPAQQGGGEVWQPMATAPKNGAGILALLPDSNFPVGVRYHDGGWHVAWDGSRLGQFDQPRKWMRIPDEDESTAPPSAGVGVDGGINIPAAKALIEIVGPGFKVIYRDAFRWKDASGNVLPNHYEMFSAETLARDFGYDLVLDLGYAAILRDPSALAQQPAAAGEESSKGADVARPKRRPYNASGSLSEYGVFPECDAQQPAAVDDAMVERAWVAFCEDTGPARSAMRAALTAALAAQHQEPTT